jgi:hypothetical protein
MILCQVRHHRPSRSPTGGIVTPRATFAATAPRSPLPPPHLSRYALVGAGAPFLSLCGRALAPPLLRAHEISRYVQLQCAPLAHSLRATLLNAHNAEFRAVAAAARLSSGAAALRRAQRGALRARRGALQSDSVGRVVRRTAALLGL